MQAWVPSEMARAPRLTLPGELHYVVQRGHNDQGVFADDQDREHYLEMLRSAGLRYGLAVHAYVLTNSEIHLLATPSSSESLSRVMQSIGRRYVAQFNRRHQRAGTLWAGRFRATLIDGDAHGKAALVFVESLPARSGLVSSHGEWPWSSAAHHLGRRRDPLITEHSSYWALGNTPFERELAHADNLREGLATSTVEAFELAARGGRVHGSAAFLEHVESRSGRNLKLRPRGRPRSTSPP